MKTSTFFALVGLGLLAGYAGFSLIENYIHETVIYPPEVLARPYLTFDYGPDQIYLSDLTVRFDPERPVIFVELNNGTLTESYDYSLHLISRAKTMDYEERRNHPGAQDPEHIVPGHYAFENDGPRRTRWAYDGEISDLSEAQAAVLDTKLERAIIDYTSNPQVRMKDWSIQFDGEWHYGLGAYATGDNLFGVAEKHTLPMAFYTGFWTLIVQGRPVFRQKVKNLPIGADFYYSPVYGLVLLEYHKTERQSTLYVIKVPASGPDIYLDLKGQKIIGTMPKDKSLD